MLMLFLIYADNIKRGAPQNETTQDLLIASLSILLPVNTRTVIMNNDIPSFQGKIFKVYEPRRFLQHGQLVTQCINSPGFHDDSPCL